MTIWVEFYASELVPSLLIDPAVVATVPRSIAPVIADACADLADLGSTAGWSIGLLAQDTSAANGPPQAAPLFSGSMVFIAASVFLFYSLVLAPERRRKSEAEHLRHSLKKNDRVVTAGGIHGSIAAIHPEDDFVTVRVDNHTRLKVSKSAIAKVVADDTADDGSADSE